MPISTFFLVSYDTHDVARRRRLRRTLQALSTGNQLSVYEQFPSPAEQRRLLDDLALTRSGDDSLWAFRIDPRARKIVLGTATPAAPWPGMVIS